MSEDFDPEELEEPLVDDPARLVELERIEEGDRLADVYCQSAEQVLASAKLEPDWLVPNAIPAGAVTYFVGKPGAAKSWLAYDLAVAVTCDRDWLGFGKPQVCSNPTALILNYDNPDAECGRRFLRLGLSKDANMLVHSWGTYTGPDGYPAVLQFGLDKQGNSVEFEIMSKIIYAKRPKLIVVDSLRQSHNADESSSQEMAQVISQVKRFTLLGCTVVIVHHVNKTTGTMRGSTEIEASADAITEIEKEDAQVSIVNWKKTRGWEMAESTMTIRVVDEGDRTYVRGGTTLSQALAGGALSRTDLGKALELSPAASKRLVDKAVENGKVFERRTSDGARLIELVTTTYRNP